MNHRQWKKAYKKKHGYNPDEYTDKKKRDKILRQGIKAFQSIDFIKLGEALADGFRKATEIVCETTENLKRALENIKEV